MSFGRIEQENAIRMNLEKRLTSLPAVLSQFYYWMDARDRSVTTMSKYIGHVVEFMNIVTNNNPSNNFYASLTDTDIDKYLIAIRYKNVNGQRVAVGDDIRATKWSAVNTFFTFLHAKKYVTMNLMDATERPKVRTQHEVVYMNPDEIKSVFRMIETNSRPMLKNRDVCIVALGLNTGLRVSAIVNINLEDINFQERTIKVVEKGHKTRTIPYSAAFAEILEAWMSDRKLYFSSATTNALFVSQIGNRICADAVRKMVKKYSSHLSKHITPHKLRSSAATNLHANGVGIVTIANMLGHSQITTTQRYTAAVDAEKESALSVLDGLIEF